MSLKRCGFMFSLCGAGCARKEEGEEGRCEAQKQVIRHATTRGSGTRMSACH